MTTEDLLRHVGRSLLYSAPELLIWCVAAMLAMVLLSRKPAVAALLGLAALTRLGLFVFSQAAWYAASLAFLSGSNLDYEAYGYASLARSMVGNTVHSLLFVMLLVAVFAFRGDSPEPELPPEA